MNEQTSVNEQTSMNEQTKELKNGLVSVLMPVYNGAEFLADAIQSVLAQSYAEWELIVVDDGSTDLTAEIVHGVTDERIRYHYQSNKGQASALNQALTLAQGEFVTTLDADDWYTVDSLKQRVEYLVAHPEDGAVYGDGYYCRKDGSLIMSFSDNRLNYQRGDVYGTLITYPLFGTGANVMQRNSVLRDHDLHYDESIVWCQDYDYYVRLAEVARFGLIPDYSLWYRLHDANMTMSMPAGRRKESLQRMKNKILHSAHFAALNNGEKFVFLQHFLTTLLADCPEEQQALLASPGVCAMPRSMRVQLQRQAAATLILNPAHKRAGRASLRAALRLDPLDPKSVLLLALSYMSPAAIERTLKAWRKWNPMPSSISPLETA